LAQLFLGGIADHSLALRAFWLCRAAPKNLLSFVLLDWITWQCELSRDKFFPEQSLYPVSVEFRGEKQAGLALERMRPSKENGHFNRTLIF
jgi:hypothetical protein